MNQSALIQSLPEHLRGFVQYQDYSRYTPQDHALWRCLMAQLSERLQQTAHAVYMDGLRLTGISLDHIPSIEEMNEALAALGWRAVVVDGHPGLTWGQHRGWSFMVFFLIPTFFKNFISVQIFFFY